MVIYVSSKMPPNSVRVKFTLLLNKFQVTGLCPGGGYETCPPTHGQARPGCRAAETLLCSCYSSTGLEQQLLLLYTPYEVAALNVWESWAVGPGSPEPSVPDSLGPVSSAFPPYKAPQSSNDAECKFLCGLSADVSELFSNNQHYTLQDQDSRVARATSRILHVNSYILEYREHAKGSRVCSFCAVRFSHRIT